MRILAILGTLFCLVLSGCCEILPGNCVPAYTATGTCTACTGAKFPVESFTPRCTQEAAIADLQIQCGERGVIDNVEYDTRKILASQCDDSPTLKPVRDTAAILHDTYKTVSGNQTSKVNSADDPPVCPKPPIDFKVIVYNDYRPLDSCPQVREMRVSYTKFIDANQSQVVTQSANVAFGASHEFSCTDAVVVFPNPNTMGLAFSFQAYGGTTEQCTVIPFAQGQFGLGVRPSELSDGCTVEARQHPANGAILTTITPGGQARSETVAVVKKLKPIPDPLFSRP